MLPTRRYLPLLIAGAALIAAACRDAITPRQPSAVAANIVKLGGGPQSWASLWDSTLAYENADTVSFTIDPAGGTSRIGDFRLEYEANSVCDPETSGYGPDTWLQPCTTIDTAITMHGKFWFENGRAYAEFSPNIRFAPDKQVYLWLKRPKALSDSAFVNYNVFFTTVVGDTRYYIDEAYSDSTMQTMILEDGTVRRRIRHFSGYNIFSGEPCDDTVGDPDCVDGFQQ
jgi:hypothetical protein